MNVCATVCACVGAILTDLMTHMLVFLEKWWWWRGEWNVQIVLLGRAMCSFCLLLSTFFFFVSSVGALAVCACLRVHVLCGSRWTNLSASWRRPNGDANHSHGQTRCELNFKWLTDGVESTLILTFYYEFSFRLLFRHFCCFWWFEYLLFWLFNFECRILDTDHRANDERGAY